MNYIQETREAGREVFPDLVRAAALVGIALVNVALFAWPMSKGGYVAGGLESTVDQAAYFSVSALFLMKSYTLFSFMFGVGFAYQMMSADRAGTGFSGRYWRRIIGLFAFAAINIAFLFQGDILFVYAVLGSILFLFRKSSPKTLIGWGIGLYVVQIIFMLIFAGLIALGEAFAPEEMQAAAGEMAAAGAAYTEAYLNAGFIAVMQARVSEWTGSIGFILGFQGWGTMAFFLFGLAAVRNDLISRADAPFWKRARRVFLPIGLIISLAGAWLVLQGTSMVSSEMMWGMLLITIGSPFASAGYLGLLAKWTMAGNGPIKTFLARGGTASLTAYLLQGLIFTLIFYEYGLGLYMQVGAAGCFVIALLVAIASIVFTSLWRTKFRRGPTEEVLRRWTYLK